MSTDTWWITTGCILFALFITVFAICVQSSRYEDEDIGPTQDTYHDHTYEVDEDANS